MDELCVKSVLVFSDACVIVLLSYSTALLAIFVNIQCMHARLSTCHVSVYLLASQSIDFFCVDHKKLAARSMYLKI